MSAHDQPMRVTDRVSPVAQHHVEKAVDSLIDEFGDHHSRATVERLMDDSVQQLIARGAEVDDFVPTLAHRFTRERLKALARAQGPESAQPDVLFIGLGDTGRGQMAAALVTLRSEGRIVAHSAGSSMATGLEPSVIEAMSELGVDLSEAFPKPLSAEVMGAADIAVTMGRSVSGFKIPEETRHVDWRVGDPTGAPLEEVRRVRDDIDRRVQALLAELNS
jgi:arsenate reductase (thioredoxin)